MRIELQSGQVRLGRRQILRIREGAGRRICVDQGAVWITETADPADVVLETGACYALKRDGLVLVTGLGDSVLSVN